MSPISSWDSPDNATFPNLVWRAKFDDRYLIEVHRAGDNQGELYIFDHDKADKEIFSKKVSLSYSALFGADTEDICEWQELIADFIDNQYTQEADHDQENT